MSTRNTNLLQPTGLKLVIDRKNYPNLEFFVQSVDHSSVTIAAAEASYPRIGSVPQIGDKLEFGEVTFNLILDEDLMSYTEMFNWMKRLVQENYKPQTTKNFGEPASETDIALLILNSSNVQQKKFIYRNAFPTNLANITLDASTSDPTPIVVPVSFRYTYFDLL